MLKLVPWIRAPELDTESHSRRSYRRSWMGPATSECESFARRSINTTSKGAGQRPCPLHLP
jgi:hypothetical protein